MLIRQPKDRLAFISRAVLPVVVIVLISLALLPDETPTPAILGSHTINHIAAFAVVAALLTSSIPNRHWCYSFIIANTIGVLIEILQWLFTEDREPSVTDLALNLFGSGLGVLLGSMALFLLTLVPTRKSH